MTGVRPGSAEIFAEQKFAHGIRAVLGRIDQRDAIAEQPRDGFAQKRVMRAAEHERVDPFLHEWADVLHDDFVGDGALQPAFFNERDQERAGARAHLHFWIERAKRALVSAAVDRSAGADDAHVAVASRGDGGLRARLNHSGDRDGQSGGQLGKGEGRRGIAGDYDCLRVLAQKHRGDFKAVALHRRRALSAVRDARGVAEIKNGLVRQQSPQRAHDRETADAGVEYPDRLRIAAALCRIAIHHRR